ncbi:hypothetical protein GDO86_011095 [Hymenochirus boettgeri]|uniref:Clusterin C-terminal domain-containing protein n=1 Tax=Hymenochirus boettgeri TaxID=247094 RepID=A0A8T2JCU0_9PIPI|nr:hypothetical protein GDO86_011095 [Hymenochirus boettgeri]
MISLNHCDWLGLFLYFYDFGNAVYQAIINAAYKIFKYIHKEGNVFFSPLEGSEHYFKDSNLMYSTTVCAELQNSSQCLRYQGKCQLCYEAFLKDCPDVLELHVKSEEAVRLVGLAGKQFQDLGNIVHQHANNTSLIINQLKERYGWMAKHSNMLSVTDIFSIKKVTFSPSNDYATANETLVELSIMKSPNFVVLIPGNLDLHNPSLIQYLSERALQYYKNNFNE